MEKLEIIAIGNEILTGRTLDTNSNWLAKRITGLGGKVIRLVTVGDEIEDIVEEILSSIEHGVRSVITTGGLGPTFDDKTLEAVAEAIARRLVLDAEALDFVAQRYQGFKQKGFVDSDEMTPSRKKMALIPEGAKVLPNSVGAAPGVMVDSGKTTIVCLPGVPAELKAIFEDHLVDWLKSILGERILVEREMITNLGDESKLAEIIDLVMKRVENVYLKSKPKYFGKDVRLEVCIAASGEDEAEANERIDRAMEELRGQMGVVQG